MGKYSFICLMILLVSQVSNAQQTSENGAFGGANGIFVYLGETPVTESQPVNGIALYKVERKAPADKEWKQIAEVKGPANESEFTQQLSKAVQHMPYDVSFLNTNASKIWSEYQKYKRVDSLKSWISFIPVMESFGILYYDQSASPKVVYEYRVQHCDKSGNPQKTFTFKPTSFPGKNSAKALTYSRYDALSHQVTLYWYSSTTKTPVFARVYRQNKTGGEWMPVKVQTLRFNSADTAWVSITDTTVSESSLYRYKLVPLDYYGNPGEEATSTIVGIYNFVMQAPVFIDIKAKSAENEPGINVSWHIDNTSLVNSIQVFRSENYDKDYKQITEVSPTTSDYTDQTVLPNTKYFYYLKLTGPLGEKSVPSTRVFAISDDKSAPLPPKIFEAAGIPQGIQLKIGITESDLSGIRIYRADVSKGNLYPISDLVKVKDHIVTWKDTSHMLLAGQFYGYAAKSENASGVTSIYSDTVFVSPGKTTKPTKVIGLNGSYRDSYVQLYWLNMQHADQWVSGYLVYRKELPDGKEKLLTDSVIPADRNSFTDRTILQGKSYAYSIESVDDYGNKSDRSEQVTIAAPLEIVPVPEGLAAFPVETGIRLTWNQAQMEGLKEYKIYRYVRGGKPSPVGTVKNDATPEFIDKLVKSGQLYFYYITSVSNDNRESKPTGEVGVRK